MSQKQVIEVEHLSCKIGNHYLLKDINWNVSQGDRWVVFGMNGSGKTTLLTIISGFKKFTSGNLTIFNQTYTNENVIDIRKKIGFVSSSFFDRHYTRESLLNIVLSGKTGTLGLNSNLSLADVVNAKELLEKFNLGDRINYGFHMLSKGERQNVLIARALFSKPDILILDEPCSGLDIFHRSLLFDTLNELGKKDNLTMIYVTHYPEEILPLFNKSIFLKNGTVLAQGSTNNLFTEDLLTQMINCPVHLTKDDEKYHLNPHFPNTLKEIILF